MPEKLKASQKIRNKKTGKVEVEHFYLKSMSIKDLEDQINATNTKPKIKYKCLKELIRRKK